jgi:hypothetical protein
VREETHPQPVCVHCGLPITREQHPPVRLTNGAEVHFECLNDYEDEELERRR